jgi:hypothetical protein
MVNDPKINLDSLIRDQKIEIYKIFVDTAERNVERRMRTNQFYFSLVAASFIAYSYLAEGSLKSAIISVNHAEPIIANVPSWALPLFLLIISMSWFSALLSFRALSAAKYSVILNLEKELEFEPFNREWEYYKQARKIETTQIELAIPILFYFVGILGIVIWFLNVGGV